jgi:1-acyl-sn-glycerol-3-phosphate acyltransferase
MSSSRSDIVRAAKTVLLEQAVAFVGGRSTEEQERFQQRVETLIAEAPEDDLFEVVERLRTAGETWGYNPPNAFARRMHHAMGDAAIPMDSALDGLEHLGGLEHARLLFLPNHLSYADVNVFEILLVRYGQEALAARLTAIAGPKVYSDPFRRFSSLCFGTIKTPQSSARSSGEAVMSAREVARLARGAIVQAHARLDAGDALLLFVEGTRSRTGGMQPALAATTRYFEHPDLWLVPVGIVGSERLVPVGGERVIPTRLGIQIGSPLRADALLSQAGAHRQLAADVVGLKIAQLLPESYRGVYGGALSAHGEAGQLAMRL